MILQSLIREHDRLVPAEVEVLLLPGLPHIHLLGLPDQVIKESLHRVRSALRSQGFEWPKARQVLVNIRPVDRRKSSRGLEFAIAAGLLWETGQKPPPLQQKGLYVYGELSLSGEVIEPEDLATDFLPEDGDLVMTGSGTAQRGFSRLRVRQLADLDRPELHPMEAPMFEIRRPPEGLRRSFTAVEARALSIAALGGHHWLLAGASGGGKTTLARALWSLLDPPNAMDQKTGRLQEGWRPWVAPHHSASALSLVGGGMPPRPGEISRADGGILFLDELLEFSPAVQEALREPVERGVIRLSRGHHSQIFPAALQLVATTNLCPCGRWAPGVKVDCGRSLRRCASVLERISGPFFDRFDFLTFATGRRQVRDHSGEDLLLRLEAARAFRANRPSRGKPGMSPDDEVRALWEDVEEPWRSEFRKSNLFHSERRRLSTLRVARSLADLDASPTIRGRHWEEALEWTLKNFERLRTASLGI
ncbi:MAG: ATP-binding protein [Bdellovibrionaceae bacterium]|nr:ATP-binding protein [Pseudobdellovibrionaceae bacterium]